MREIAQTIQVGLLCKAVRSDIEKALDNVLVIRIFTICQLQSAICDIEKTLERYNSKVLIIPDILKPFSDVKERRGKSPKRNNLPINAVK